MNNLIIGLLPLIVCFICLIAVIVRSIAAQYGYRFFVVPILASIVFIMWIWYWIIK